MPTWPAGLPQDALVGVTVKPDDSVLRTPMDSGPPTTRNRFTAITKSMNVPLFLTGAEVATLETFFHTTLKNGALSFDWKDPRTDATVSMKFKEPPNFGGMVGDDTVNDRLWGVDLSLEILP